ncbi:unnamed protein product [Echinostoma caproni]|uniref:Ephrin_rec_like domain-containing protein n=1 Tax=Echinostoma caproni TaxID=27848 RepID=A0A183AD82_9TREM|nr:unnamed protein product [Echinostoma caproni]
MCPTGTFAPNRLVSPAPPRIGAQYQRLLTDQPYLADKHASEAEVSDWLNHEHQTICQPCPSNTYSEEKGRVVCLPCPVWHMMPADPEGERPSVTGSDWLHEACPREGRAEVRLVQVAEGMLGRRFAKWVHNSSPLTRVGTLVIVTLIPLFLAVILLFIAYVLIDVGATLVKMAKKMHPLQVQLAETTTATAQFKAEQRRAAAEAYARMKGN